MNASLPKFEVVLWGIGHTHAHIVRMWRMRPIAGARLTCVSDFPTVTYSGMLPGVLSGQYPRERMEIDLVRLAAAAGARLIVGRVTGLDRAARQLVLDDRPALPFDLLSIGIGSVPTRDGVDLDRAGGALVAIKPMQTFLDRLDARLGALADRRPLRVVVVGGGAGGVEVAFCLPPRVGSVLGALPMELTLINAKETVVAGLRPGTVARVRRRLEQRGVALRLGRRVVRVGEGAVTLDDGTSIAADLVLWATGADAPAILARLDLPTDDRGFLLTRPNLQSLADPAIFAVGDTGTIADQPTPKAGVYAVRQGPVLWENLRRAVEGRRPAPYVPQRGFLKLLNTGDGRAIAEYRGRSFEGRWCWRLKDAIDRRFINKYQDFRPIAMRPSAMPSPGANGPAMRCAGCGGKVGGSILSRVLGRLDNPSSPRVLVGLESPDDAAVIAPREGRPLVVTADFFAAPLDDPYLVGRLAALHAASDAFAMGATPMAALALVTVPFGPPRRQEECLFELLAGGLREFRRMGMGMGAGVSLAGGHTIEGPQLTIGFTLLADPGPGPLAVKGGLRPGDRLVLTKPLGTGILLAAQMRAACRAVWMEPLLRSMLLSNESAAALLDGFEVRGLTDVTGFGLAGHLLEMLRAAGHSAEVDLDAVPLLPGVAELVAQGIESTLAPANRAAEEAIEISPALRSHAAYAALFDPQTCGGLLLGVPEPQVEPLLRGLAARSDVPARPIGRVEPAGDGPPRLRIT